MFYDSSSNIFALCFIPLAFSHRFPEELGIGVGEIYYMKQLADLIPRCTIDFNYA